MALRENMTYDAERDEYTCQAGEKLKVTYVGKQKTKSGYEREKRSCAKFLFCHSSLSIAEVKISSRRE